MAASHELVSHVLELLAPMGHARSRRMFGGWGIYLDDVFIALIAFERLYLKVDELSRAEFEAAGCEPFVYEGKPGEVHVMSYWSAPAEALESPGEMRVWAHLALGAALRAKAAAKPKAIRPKPAGRQAATAARGSSRAATRGPSPSTTRKAKPSSTATVVPARTTARPTEQTAAPAARKRAPKRTTPKRTTGPPTATRTTRRPTR
jgi:DNA transformation protein